MFKDFFKWNTVQAKLETEKRTVQFRAQEIWWCSVGANVGVEASGKNQLFERPVLVFRRFNKDMFWGLPLTSQIQESKAFHFSFSIHSKDQTAVMSQMRVLSSRRLVRRLGKISDRQFALLNKAVVQFIKETDPLTSNARGPRVPNGSKSHNHTRASKSVKSAYPQPSTRAAVTSHHATSARMFSPRLASKAFSA